MTNLNHSMLVALCLALASCGGNGDGNGEDATTDPDVVEESAEDVTPEVAEDPAGDGEDLQTCGEVITCMNACGNDETCVAACMATICPASATALTDFTTCILTNCETECADRTSTECQGCVTTDCVTELGACMAASC